MMVEGNEGAERGGESPCIGVSHRARFMHASVLDPAAVALMKLRACDDDRKRLLSTT